MPVLQLCCCIFLLFAGSSAHSEPIRIITEDYPPYNYIENGELKGLSVDIVREVMGRTQLDYYIDVLPWARGMATAERNKNVFIFSMRKIPSRENRFIWIGVLSSASQSIFTTSNRQDVKIESIADLKNYRVSTTINDSRDSLLIDEGIPRKNLTRISGHDAYERNYMKLKFGRIDVWPMDDVVAFHIVRRNGDNPEQTLKKVYSFESGLNAPYYLAANLNSDPNIVAEVFTALRRFKETSEYFTLLERWGGTP